MKKEETSEHVRLAATNALFNSLEFTRANFEKESERHYIMQVVCEASQSTNTQVRSGTGCPLIKGGGGFLILDLINFSNDHKI